VRSPVQTSITAYIFIGATASLTNCCRRFSMRSMAGQMLPGKATTALPYRFTGGNPNILWHWYIAVLALAREHEQDGGRLHLR